MSLKPDAEARHERALRRLGTRNPVCIHCGESNPLCLEAHHIAGRSNHSDTVLVCRNCHRKLSDKQQDRPSIPAGGNGNDELGQIGRYLIGLADTLQPIATTLAALGKSMLDRGGQKP